MTPWQKVRWLFVIGLVLLQAGCWDRTEINDLAIVSGVALDKAGPESIELTVAFVRPSGVTAPGWVAGGGQTPGTTTKAATGRSGAGKGR